MPEHDCADYDRVAERIVYLLRTVVEGRALERYGLSDSCAAGLAALKAAALQCIAYLCHFGGCLAFVCRIVVSCERVHEEESRFNDGAVVLSEEGEHEGFIRPHAAESREHERKHDAEQHCENDPESSPSPCCCSADEENRDHEAQEDEYAKHKQAARRVDDLLHNRLSFCSAVLISIFDLCFEFNMFIVCHNINLL